MKSHYLSHRYSSPAQFRQQHRRTVDGRLCSAAFVQNRETYTGCTDAPSPAGDSGREWCYVESTLLKSGDAAWSYCAPVVNYDSLRVEAKSALENKVGQVRLNVIRMQKAQRAAEKALDKYEKLCA